MSDTIVDGDRVLACPFCGGVYATPGKVGTRVDCPADQGGCGAAYRIQTYASAGPGEPTVGN